MTRGWFLLAMALVGCKKDEKDPVAPIVGCYSVADSRDPRYQRGDRMCLLSKGIVLSSSRSLGDEAYDVAWSASGNDFRATVPPEQTGGAKVEFSVTRSSDGKLDFKVGETWMTVRLEGRSEPDGQAVLGQLEACRGCIAEAARLGGKDAKPPAHIYGLRSCIMYFRVTGAPCPALGLKGR